MNIADILGTVRLNLDTGEFELQAAKATDKATASMGQRMKKAAGGILGTGLGAAVGIALSGANQLDAVTRQLQADTGMTAEEAKKAQGALAGMYRNNLQGFDAIGAAMGKVRTDLGLVGDAADKATAKFLKFGTATGQDAAAAVAAFDDILDAWNLTADDSQALMDGLIADHQKFGGVIADSQAALAAMAPAMQAANMEIDDGRALLNLFNAAGIDAAKAPAALAKAVKELKPGQTLNDLIAQMGAIEDPTLRAQEAMRIFGARSGIGLAQAIRPGMTSLDSFAISAAEAAGSTDEAAKAIEEGFGNRFKLLLKNASGALAEFGTNFGDLVMIAALIGPQMLTKLTAGIGGIVGTFGPALIKMLAPKMAAVGAAMGLSAATAEVAAQTTGVVAGQAAVGAAAAPAAAGAGTVIGTAMGVAAAAAIVTVGAAAIALAFKSIVLDPALQQQSRDIGAATARNIAEGTLQNLQDNRAALEYGIAEMNKLPLGGILYGDQIRDAQRDLDAVDAEIVRRAEATGSKVPEGLAAGAAAAMPQWSGKVEDIVKFFGTSMAGVKAAAKEAGADGMLAMASGITAARQRPLDAFNTLKEMLKDAMTPLAEAARLKGELTSKTLAAGLKSGDPAVRAQAQAVAKAAADRLGELAAGGGKAGRAAMAALDRGVRSKIPAVREAAIAARDAAKAKLDGLKPQAATAGANAGASFAAALRRAVASGDFRINASVGFTIPGRAAGGPITGPSWVGEKGPEIYVPRQAGTILSREDSMAAVRGAGGVTVNVYNPVPEPASTSTRRELRKLALSGSAS